MKKFYFIATALMFLISLPVSAKEDTQPSDFTYEYKEIASQILSVSRPYEKDGHIVFTAKDGPRHIGIAFDFENYQIIHSFQKKSNYDMDGKPTDTYFFYILQTPDELKSISYRLVVDGLWTTDPLNDSKKYDASTGIYLSTLRLNREIKQVTETKKTEGVHFVYKGKSGEKIRLAGTFSNWDSWIYEMKETSYGVYELYLPLPKGTYYYSYYHGTKSMPDRTNPDRAFSKDGRIVSLLTVD